MEMDDTQAAALMAAIGYGSRGQGLPPRSLMLANLKALQRLRRVTMVETYIAGERDAETRQRYQRQLAELLTDIE